MTPTPSAKLAWRPSFRLLTPNPTPSSTKTKHATGIENFSWMPIIGRCGETPASRILAASSRSCGMVSSPRPRYRFSPSGNSDSASIWIVSSSNACTSYAPGSAGSTRWRSPFPSMTETVERSASTRTRPRSAT